MTASLAKAIAARGEQPKVSPGFIAEPAARFRERAEQVAAERREKFASLMPGIDLLKARCGAVVTFADNGRGDTFGKESDTASGLPLCDVQRMLLDSQQQEQWASKERVSKPKDKPAKAEGVLL